MKYDKMKYLFIESRTEKNKSQFVKEIIVKNGKKEYYGKDLMMS